MTTSYDRIGWRAMLMTLALLFAVMGALFAKSENEQEQEVEEYTDGEAPNDAPVTIEATSLKARQDSVFAIIDENFKLVKPIIEGSCFDCHSANTDFPWYHKIPGIKQFLNGHVKEGREHLDFTDGFPFAGEHEPLEQLADIKHEITEGKMPLLSYRLIHWGAWLKQAEKDSIYEWVDSSTVALTRFYDSEQIAYKKPVSGESSEH